MKLTPVLIIALGAASTLACKKKGDQPPQSSYQQPQCGGYNQPPCQPVSTCGGVGQPACPAPAPSTTATTAPTDPLQALIGGFLSATSSSLSAFTGGELGPIQGGIELRAKEDAKGMRPVGQLMSAKLQQGSHAEGDLLMEPGKCYTIVGFGGFGVSRFQINVIVPVVNQVLAQSPDGSPAPTLGPKDQCLRTPAPAPMPVKVDLYLIQGQGMVGAQAYVK